MNHRAVENNDEMVIFKRPTGLMEQNKNYALGILSRHKSSSTFYASAWPSVPYSNRVATEQSFIRQHFFVLACFIRRDARPCACHCCILSLCLSCRGEVQALWFQTHNAEGHQEMPMKRNISVTFKSEMQTQRAAESTNTRKRFHHNLF